MRFRKKRNKIRQELPENVLKRANMINPSELINWAEITLQTVDRQLLAVSRARPDDQETPFRLGEALQAAEALVGILRAVESSTKVRLATTPPSIPSATELYDDQY